MNIDDLDYSLERRGTQGWAWCVGAGLPGEEKGLAADKHGAIEEIASIYCGFLEMALLVQAEDFGHAVVSKMLDKCHDDLFLAALDYIETNEEAYEEAEKKAQPGYDIIIFIPELDLADGM